MPHTYWNDENLSWRSNWIDNFDRSVWLLNIFNEAFLMMNYPTSCTLRHTYSCIVYRLMHFLFFFLFSFFFSIFWMQFVFHSVRMCAILYAQNKWKHSNHIERYWSPKTLKCVPDLLANTTVRCNWSCVNLSSLLTCIDFCSSFVPINFLHFNYTNIEIALWFSK